MGLDLPAGRRAVRRAGAAASGLGRQRADNLRSAYQAARPGVAGGVLLSFVTAGVVGIVNITVPAFLEAPRASGYGGAASVLQSGIDLLPFAAANTAAGYVSGRLTRRLSPSVIAIVTLCLESLGLALLAGLHHTATQVVILVAVVGAGHGGTLAAEYVLLTLAARPAEAGPAAGLGSAAAGVSGAVATAAITPVLMMRLVQGRSDDAARSRRILPRLAVRRSAGCRRGHRDSGPGAAGSRRGRAASRRRLSRTLPGRQRCGPGWASVP